MIKMEFKEFLSKFVKYNKKNINKLIVISILVFYFAFLIFYNQFRVILQYSLESSWLYGIVFSLISTVVLVLLLGVLRVPYLVKSGEYI